MASCTNDVNIHLYRYSSVRTVNTKIFIEELRTVADLFNVPVTVHRQMCNLYNQRDAIYTMQVGRFHPLTGHEGP